MADTNIDSKFINWENLKYFWNCAKDYINDNGIINITYSDLKTLRDNSQLVVGQMYRITDYVTTTVQSETKSTNHPFDIIVIALSKNALDEKASAIAHEGDTYFDGNDLGAWELWYDLDNDTNKYEWADETNGKGIIYRMIDEKRNDCPYDFKNILFYNDKLTSVTTSDRYYYTFSYVVSGKLYDGTVEKQVITCYNNSMKMYIKNTKKQLNKNVFGNNSFNDNCYSNTFGENCHSNTFGCGCYSNTFGNDCYSNKFGNYCSSNTFGDACNANTFGNNCTSNTFGNNCTSNTFGNYCEFNTFSNRCTSNTFGNNCTSNIFDCSCYSNTFGNNCTSNKFGNYCESNKFGDNCKYDIFSDNCSFKYLDHEKTSTTLNNEYYDDGSNKLVPIKHPDLSTQPSILPYKFMGQYVYEQLISVDLLELRGGAFAIPKELFLYKNVLVLGCDLIGLGTYRSATFCIPNFADDIYIVYGDSSSENNNAYKYIKIVYTLSEEYGSGNYYGYNEY